MKKLGYFYAWQCYGVARTMQTTRSREKMPYIFSYRRMIIIGHKLWTAWCILLPVKGLRKIRYGFG